MFVYQHSIGAAPGMTAQSQIKIWVGVKDRFPTKQS